MHRPDPPSRHESLARLEAKLAAFNRSAYSPQALQEAAALWARRAQNEHASIAAFDRFCLGLLAVAAPPELVEAAHEAALDEILHARICFAVASTYGEKALGPGPLPIDGALDGMGTLGALVEATLVEGCIGETISAAEAREAYDHATEAVAREALSRIADDEERHAELAWAFVRWGITMAPELLPGARALFDAAIPKARVAVEEPMPHDLTELGILPSSHRARLRERILNEVIVPASRTLFDCR